jgi:hypothetical protein
MEVLIGSKPEPVRNMGVDIIIGPFVGITDEVAGVSIDKAFVNVAARPPAVMASFIEAPSPILATLHVTLVYDPPHSVD